MFSFDQKTLSKTQKCVNLFSLQVPRSSLCPPYIHYSDKIAQRLLKEANWNVELAMDTYYTSKEGGNDANRASHINTRKVEQLFEQYQDKDDKVIGVEGTEQFCNDLQVDPSDVVLLVIAYYMRCPRMCEFTRQSWIEGWTKLQCDSLDKMRALLPDLRRRLKEEESLHKEVYHYAFMFGREEGQKGLALDTAIGLWQLLLQGTFQLLDEWIEFVQEHHKRSVPRDTWNLVRWHTLITIVNKFSV